MDEQQNSIEKLESKDAKLRTQPRVEMKNKSVQVCTLLNNSTIQTSSREIENEHKSNMGMISDFEALQDIYHQPDVHDQHKYTNFNFNMLSQQQDDVANPNIITDQSDDGDQRNTGNTDGNDHKMNLAQNDTGESIQ